MLRGIKLIALVVAVGASMALSGCAESVYPRLPSLGGLGSSLLSKSEQQKEIKDLTAEQKSHGEAAVEEIERRN